MKISELEGMSDVKGVPLEFLQEDFHSVDGVFIRKIHLPIYSVAPQHAHLHSHVTIVGKGHVKVWKNTSLLGEFTSGEIIEIEANVQHTFLALEDTDLFCIHNEEHALVVFEGKIEA